MTQDEIMGLVGYPWWLFALAVILLITAVLSWFFLPVSRSQRPPRGVPGLVEPVFSGTFSSEISALQKQFLAGELSLAELHLAAADIARRFGSNQVGVDISNHTLRQLRWRRETAQLAGAINVVALSERPSFDLDVQVAGEQIFTALSEMLADGGAQ